jgi:hypothetical protein
MEDRGAKGARENILQVAMLQRRGLRKMCLLTHTYTGAKDEGDEYRDGTTALISAIMIP